MTDEEWVYQTEIREKKRNGRGYFNKVNGSKSKKCTLPYEKLTKKELMKMNSECKTWDLKNLGYTFEEFKEMPHDIQEEYVNRILKKYSISIVTIDKYMFGGKTTFTKYCVRNGIKFINRDQKHKWTKEYKEGVAKFMEDVKEAKPTNEETPKLVEAPEKPVLDMDVPVNATKNVKMAGLAASDISFTIPKDIWEDMLKDHDGMLKYPTTYTEYLDLRDEVEERIAAKEENHSPYSEYLSMTNEVELKSDPVTHPSHYTSAPNGVECIDAILGCISSYKGNPETAWLVGQVVKYLWRAPLKGRYKEDISKAAFYMNKIAEINSEADHAE